MNQVVDGGTSKQPSSNWWKAILWDLLVSSSFSDSRRLEDSVLAGLVEIKKICLFYKLFSSM